jgi:hypothetical protein
MCLGLAAGCCSSIALSLGCATCGAVGGVVSKATRFSYALMLLMATFLAVTMLTDSLKSWILDSFKNAWSLPEVECEGLDCFSVENLQQQAQNAVVNQTMTSAEQKLEVKLERVVGALAVDRVMLGVAVFHFIMAIALLGVQNSRDARARLQNEAWSIKVALYVGLIVCMFWVDTAHFDNVTGLFKVGACLFILLQLTMLIDGAYNSYDFLATRMDEYGPGWTGLTVCCTLFMYGFSLFVFGVTVAKHTREDEGCSEGIWAVMLGFLFMIATSVLSVSGFVRDATNGAGASNGIFQSGMVSAYASYQVLSALINHPEQRCHLMDINDGSTSVKLIGLFFTFVAVLWSAVRNGSHTEGGDGLTTTAGGGGGTYEMEAGGGAKKAEDDEAGGVKYNYSWFHVTLGLASMYIAMLLTRWGEIEGIDKTLKVVDSETSVWIKIYSSWMCFGLYALVMILPPACPDRSFAGDHELTAII